MGPQRDFFDPLDPKLGPPSPRLRAPKSSHASIPTYLALPARRGRGVGSDFRGENEPLRLALAICLPIRVWGRQLHHRPPCAILDVFGRERPLPTKNRPCEPARPAWNSENSFAEACSSACCLPTREAQLVPCTPQEVSRQLLNSAVGLPMPQNRRIPGPISTLDFGLNRDAIARLCNGCRPLVLQATGETKNEPCRRPRPSFARSCTALHARCTIMLSYFDSRQRQRPRNLHTCPRNLHTSPRNFAKRPRSPTNHAKIPLFATAIGHVWHGTCASHPRPHLSRAVNPSHSQLLPS